MPTYADYPIWGIGVETPTLTTTPLPVATYGYCVACGTPHEEANEFFCGFCGSPSESNCSAFTTVEFIEVVA